ncbi:MAG TPA: GerMN domain-containing protein [Vicinamibacterales bacterium]|nr:GerMN domain-containing protein [Vicinamibacterales bacterium]
MSAKRLLAAAGIVAAAILVAWVLFVALPRRTAAPTAKGVASSASTPTAASSPATSGRKITARLFYVADDGLHLTAVEREVPFGATTVDQATAIVNAQLAAAQPPLVSAIPAGTTLLALYVTDQGDAYVDLSPEASQNHPGGTTAELLTVYTIVDALTMNLPAISAVQILVNGQEVDTLAGHVDLRRPLQKDLAFIQAAAPAPAAPPSGTGR